MFTLRAGKLDHCLQRATEFFCQEHIEINKTTVRLCHAKQELVAWNGRGERRHRESVCVCVCFCVCVCV